MGTRAGLYLRFLLKKIAENKMELLCVWMPKYFWKCSPKSLLKIAIVFVDYVRRVILSCIRKLDWLVVWLWTDYIDSACQKQVLILNASISVVQGFSKMVSVMHLGLDVWALTHACFYMFKTEKLKASFENRSLILLYLQFPYLWNGDGDNTYHPADGKASCRKFLCLPYIAVGGRTFTVITGNVCTWNLVPLEVADQGHGQHHGQRVQQ